MAERDAHSRGSGGGPQGSDAPQQAPNSQRCDAPQQAGDSQRPRPSGSVNPKRPPRLTFRSEVRDFFTFIRRPEVSPRFAGRRADDGFWQDWFPPIRVLRLLQWAFLMWAINLLFLGPLAVMAAGLGGATHRLDIQNIPWLTALLWAPFVEELVFRYGLRRLKHLWLLLPVSIVALMNGPSMLGGVAVAAWLALCWIPYGAGSQLAHRPLSWRLRRGYLRRFPWAFHLTSLAFSAVHLYNFNLAQTPLWLLPLLVLPQWVTGMVLGWLRVRHGIGAAILLHAVFNGGPLLIVWIVLRMAPDMAM